MLLSFKLFLAAFLSFLGSATLTVKQNYNYSKVHQQALISDPILLPVKPILNAHHRSWRPHLYRQAKLHKYNLRDTGYRAQQQNLSYQDQSLLFNLQPPRGIFTNDHIMIANCKVLQLSKFAVEMNNPSEKLRFSIQEIFTDLNDIRPDDSSFPIVIPPQKQRKFSFNMYFMELYPQFLEGAIYFKVYIYDGKTLAEEKVYACKISATIVPNHLHLQTTSFRSCPRHQTLTIKNYEIFEIKLKIDGQKEIQTIEGNSLKQQILLEPTQSVKVLIQGKDGNIKVQSKAPGTQVDRSMLLVNYFCQTSVSIDYFNIGIIPDEKSVFQFPVSVSSFHKQPVLISEVVLNSTTQTVTFEEKPQFEGFVLQGERHLVIGKIRVHSSKNPVLNSSITLTIKLFTPSGNDFQTTQVFFFNQIRNPVSAGTRRFIDLQKIGTKPERFLLKNNLNIPIFLTRFICDEEYIHLSWSGERQNFIYPNSHLQSLFFEYMGPRKIKISPQKHTIWLQFNGNNWIPLEVVVYDHSLQCLIENRVQRCSDIQELDFDYLREGQPKGKQIIVRNWNPEILQLKIGLPIEEAKQHGMNMSVEIYGPLPGEGEPTKKDDKIRNFILKPNHFIVIDVEIQLLKDSRSAELLMSFTTGVESIQIPLKVKVEVINGTIALIPQVVRFNSPLQRTIQYLNLVSTYTQQYRIANVTTNLSNLIVAIPPHDDLKANQFVGMTVVYDPHFRENSQSKEAWSLNKKQQEYYLFYKRKDYEQTVYGQVILTTTTGLQAKSTIIIDKNYNPLIEETVMIDEEQGIRGIKFVLTKRKQKPSRYGDNRQVYQVTFEVRNPFPEPLKYRPFIVSDFKFRHMNNYFREYRNTLTEQKQTLLFCLSEPMKSKYRLNPSSLRQLFNLDYNPEEYTMQMNEAQIILVPKGTKNHTIVINSNKSGYDLLVSFYEKKYRTCLHFLYDEPLAKLFLSQVPYKILQQHGERAFKDFIKTQMYNIKHTSFFQTESQVPLRSRFYNFKECQLYSEYSIYRFCDPLNVRILGVFSDHGRASQIADKSYILQPYETHKITVQLFNPEDSLKLNLVLANNFTNFQTYKAAISIAEPRLYVSHDYLSSIFEQLYQQMWGKWKGANLLPIELYSQDYRTKDGVIEGIRTFQIVNQGEGELVIDHVGIDQKYHSCGQKGIQIYGLTCGIPQEEINKHQTIRKNTDKKYVLKALSSFNLTVKFLLNLKYWPSSLHFFSVQQHQFLKYVIYVYDQKGYHFKLHLIFRIADPLLLKQIQLYKLQHRSQSIYKFILISVLSALFILAVLFKVRADQNNPIMRIKEEKQRGEQDPFRRMYRLRRLTRILKESGYYDPEIKVGTKLPKRCFEKCVHKVTQDLLLSAKEVTQRDLKRYFNESQQSAIGAILGGINHNLSLSQSISDHEVLKQQPQSSQYNVQQYVQQSKQSIESPQSSSNLPEGQQVDLTDQIDEDSWYDFNKEMLNQSHNKSANNSNQEVQPEEEDQFYNVFRSDVGLKKSNLLRIMSRQNKRKHE